MERRKITKEELNKILKQHKKWLTSYGEFGNRANLSYADLHGADLHGVDLRSADLHGADLRSANLIDADLRSADLHGADLRSADLHGVNLHGADLRNADLIDAKLFDADLRNANLSYANLSGAVLSGANLRGAVLSYAKLENMRCDENTSGYWMVCPESGAFIGYKKAYIYEDDSDTDAITINGKTLRFSSITLLGDSVVIVKLQVPASAKRSSATTRKCRVSKAKVLSIESIDGKTKYEQANSGYNKRFVYKVGETVKVDNFDPDRWNECSTGIHLFMSRKEAEIY